jgi:TPR repeat protein
MMNLASLYERGDGEGQYAVAEDGDRAVKIVEEGMRLGIPAAYDKMGNYHATGVSGIKRDSSRAWAFWQLAAEMGNPQALTHIGVALAATYDGPGFWANRPIAIEMLECAVSQGFGQAAYELGFVLDGKDISIGKNYSRGLQVLHEGVKLGSEKAANSLFSKFDRGVPMVGNIKDPIRAARYSALGDALYHNPDLRFPNLDKVLPLPPAKLPPWDGNPDSLVNAAMAVSQVKRPPPTPGSQRTGRAHIPDGWVLTGTPQLPPGESVQDAQGRAWGLRARTHAHFTGYWLPRIDVIRSDWQVQWNAAQVQWHFKRAEELPSLEKHIPPGYGAVHWYYQGQPQKLQRTSAYPVQRGIAREVVRERGEVDVACAAGRACPVTGIWSPKAAEDHPQVKSISDWWHQRFIEKGQSMPDARSWGMAGEGRITWHLLEAGGLSMDAST